MPGVAHIIYIGFTLAIGLALGFVLGARVTRDAFRRERERQQRKAAADAPIASARRDI